MKRADITKLAEDLQITEHYLIVSYFLNDKISLKDIDKMYGNEKAQFWKNFFLITRQDKINKLDELNAFILEKYSQGPDLSLEDWVYIFKETLVQAQGGLRGVSMHASQLNKLAEKAWEKIISAASLDQKIDMITIHLNTPLETRLAEHLIIAAKGNIKKVAELLNSRTNSSVLMFKALKRLGNLC